VTADPDPADHSVDAFLGGLLTLVQPRKGHRAGLDAALLQAIVPAEAAGHAVDLGAGVGTVAFSLAARAGALQVTAVERDPGLMAAAQAALARLENFGFAARVRLIEADVTARREFRERLGLADHSADWVLMNPPFDAPGRARPSPDEARRAAHVAEPGSLGAWCRTAAGVLRPAGVLCLIHRAPALAEILGALAGRFGDVRILPVHPTKEAAAGRILVRAIRGSRAGLQIMPGLVLHRAGGAWTDEVEAILRGRASLSFHPAATGQAGSNQRLASPS
jgi:tRNA1(Val) A37 N6-methylase TrmN6